MSCVSYGTLVCVVKCGMCVKRRFSFMIDHIILQIPFAESEDIGGNGAVRKPE